MKEKVITLSLLIVTKRSLRTRLQPFKLDYKLLRFYALRGKSLEILVNSNL